MRCRVISIAPRPPSARRPAVRCSSGSVSRLGARPDSVVDARDNEQDQQGGADQAADDEDRHRPDDLEPGDIAEDDERERGDAQSPTTVVTIGTSRSCDARDASSTPTPILPPRACGSGR